MALDDMSGLNEALAAGKPILMDGATGTELMRAGMDPGPGVNLTHPELVQRIHESYVHAGARVLLTNTFQVNKGTRGRVIAAAVGLACAAARNEELVFASVGMPIAELFAGSLRSRIPFDQLDGILLETQSDFSIKEILPITVRFSVPVMVSMTFHRDAGGRLETVSGLTPEAVATAAEDCRIAMLGVNCGRDISLADTTTILQAYRSVCGLPLFARPNAGTPTRVGDQLIYPVTPAEMAAWVPEAIRAGAIMIGGCCGTTPEHIAACLDALAKLDR
jgi:5-methyltetrahydrofolate--homocysteine methyltransferase